MSAALGGGAFAVDGAVRMRPVAPPQLDGDASTPRVHSTVHVLELFHGPTAAFKDLGLQVLARLLEMILRGRQRHLTVLVGTSGDTGSAAMEALAGLANVDCVVLYPVGRTSRVQESQMLAAAGREDAANLSLVAVEGTSDELDVPIKALFDDPEFRRVHDLGSVNSVNIVRLVVQTVHFFWAYLQLCPKADTEATFYIPTGACGHLVAGVMARRMGLPVRLQACVNANDCLVRLVERGEIAPAARTVPTVAPAMDIASPYNLERLLWYACGGDGTAVARWAAAQAAGGVTTLPAAVVGELHDALGVGAASVRDPDALSAMAYVATHERGYLVCPHTAVGLAVTARHRPRNGGPRIVCATASPAKFVEALAGATDATYIATAARLEGYGSANESAAAALHNAQRGAELPVPPGGVRRWLRNPATRLCAGDDWERVLRGIVSGARSRSLARKNKGNKGAVTASSSKGRSTTRAGRSPMQALALLAALAAAAVAAARQRR